MKKWFSLIWIVFLWHTLSLGQITDSVLTIAEGPTSIAKNAYLNNVDFHTVIIPRSMTAIGDSAFKGCPNLRTVYFNADSCTRAGKASAPIFNSCKNITQIIIGQYVKLIPSQIFRGLKALKDITIP